jgi:methionyl-tRNA formyltransferase
VGWKVADWLREEREEIVGLVLHPPAKRKFGAELVASAGVPPERIFDGSALRSGGMPEALRELGADIGVSALFDYLLTAEVIGALPAGCVNLHPSYLPYNRGQYPNVWSIVERTPAGASLHYLDEGVDTGDLIARRRVEVEPVDTGETLYRKLEVTCLELFREYWPRIRGGRAPRSPQESGGSYHRTWDVERIDAIDLDREYRARDLIDVLRARTFPPYPGAYFEDGGRRVYLRLQLSFAEEPAPAGEKGHGGSH